MFQACCLLRSGWPDVDFASFIRQAAAIAKLVGDCNFQGLAAKGRRTRKPRDHRTSKPKAEKLADKTTQRSNLQGLSHREIQLEATTLNLELKFTASLDR